MQSCLPWRAHRSQSPSRQLLEYPTYTPSMPGVSRSSPHLQFQPRAFRLSSPVLPGCKVSRPPEVDQVPRAVVSEPDKGVLAAQAANDGAQLPHLVDHPAFQHLAQTRDALLRAMERRDAQGLAPCPANRPCGCSGRRAGQCATRSTTLPGTPDLRLASKASRPRSNGNTSPTMDLSSPASIRRASSVSAARSGSTTKKTPPVLGRPASSGGSTTETSTPPGLRSAQERRRISPPTRSKITSISPATSLKRRRSVSINSSAPSPRTRSSAHARPVATTWAPALRAS